MTTAELTKPWQVWAPALYGWQIIGEYDTEAAAAGSPQHRVPGSRVTPRKEPKCSDPRCEAMNRAPGH